MSNGAVRHDADEVRAIVLQLDENAAWDHLQARDLDPKLIDFVADLLTRGIQPGVIAQKHLGLSGKNDKRWKKIQAYFRQGFRADAEAYLFNQTQRYFKFIDRAEKVLEDAFENGTPHVTKEGEVLRVKGATPELAGFIDAYSKAIAHPVKLWKEYGAIGDKKDVGQAGTTIVVNTMIQMPSADQIRSHQEEIRRKQEAIEVKKRELTGEVESET